MHAAFDRFWGEVDAISASPPDEGWRLQFVTAVAEIAGNVVRHAYPPDHSSGRLHLTLTCFAGRVEAELRDEGVPFVGAPAVNEELASGIADIDDLEESGRGLMIARAWVDELDHSLTPTGNQWRLVKRR